MVSQFKKPEAFEMDASKGQRYALFNATKIVTTPFYEKDDDYGNKQGDPCLPPRAIAEKLGLPWLSMGKASQLIEDIGPLRSADPEAVKQARDFLLSIVQGKADRTLPRTLKNDIFKKAMDEAEAAGKAAFDATEAGTDDGLVWLSVQPGNVAFARYLKETHNAQPDAVYGGVGVWLEGDFTKAAAKCNAMVKMLQKHNLEGVKSIKAGTYKKPVAKAVA